MGETKSKEVKGWEVGGWGPDSIGLEGHIIWRLLGSHGRLLSRGVT